MIDCVGWTAWPRAREKPPSPSPCEKHSISKPQPSARRSRPRSELDSRRRAPSVEGRLACADHDRADAATTTTAIVHSSATFAGHSGVAEIASVATIANRTAATPTPGCKGAVPSVGPCSSWKICGRTTTATTPIGREHAQPAQNHGWRFQQDRAAAPAATTGSYETGDERVATVAAGTTRVDRARDLEAAER